MVAVTYRKRLPGVSRSVLLVCDDGNEYVVKGRQVGRPIITDQVVGRLGMAMGAPVGHVSLVHVPRELIVLQPELQHLQPGVAHGNLWIAGCSEDREPYNHVSVSENRPRFALIAVLYGWIEAHDHQFIYQKSSPRLVYSVDHGHFLPGSIGWSQATLTAPTAPATVDARTMQVCHCTSREINDACCRLQRITNDDIAHAVAVPPDDWGIDLDERIVLAMYLARRRKELLEAIAPVC